MRKKKKSSVPCIWLVDGEYLCAVKHRSGAFDPPIAHGRTPGEAFKTWNRLKAEYKEKHPELDAQ